MAVRERVQASAGTANEKEEFDSESWLERLVGHELIVSKGGGNFESVPTKDCRGKHILLYVSAQWCGPCRKFTPLLQEFYSEAQKNGNIDAEIVFVSLDRDEESHKVFIPLPHTCTVRDSTLSLFSVHQMFPCTRVVTQ
jgi:thiol-disulfide isomerase/thioredoxin